MRVSVIASALIIGSICSSAFGQVQMQFYDPGFWIGQNAAMVNIIGQTALQQHTEDSRFRPVDRSSTQHLNETLRQSVRTTYTPSTTRRRTNLARFVQKSRSADPVGAAAMEQLFANTDVFATMKQALAPVGLRTDDVADAYAVWWMSVWGAVHGDTSAPSRTKAQAVRLQAAQALARTAEFARADDATKQEYAEALLIQTALIDGMMEQYGSDPTMASKLAASVRQGARASGLDLDAMTLTEQGFVPAKKTGAADPAPGAPREALAATGDGKPGYGLLAAAGGAGLGAAFLIGKAMGRRG